MLKVKYGLFPMFFYASSNRIPMPWCESGARLKLKTLFVSERLITNKLIFSFLIDVCVKLSKLFFISYYLLAEMLGVARGIFENRIIKNRRLKKNLIFKNNKISLKKNFSAHSLSGTFIRISCYIL